MKLLAVLVVLMMSSLVSFQGEQKVVTLPEEVSTQLQKMNKDFLLFKPKNYSTAKASPLIIFLHGSGERGSDIKQVGKHGIPSVAPKTKDFPFIGVSPQCLRTKKGGWIVKDLDLLLDYVLKTYKVDKKRIYLTGLSMGGFGTWKWAAEKPDTFAAVAAICGGGNPKTAAKYGDLPIWAFHGDADQIVKIEKSQVMVDAIKKAGGNVKFTVYPGVKHNSWTKTYDNPELYKWFLSHTKY